MTPSQFHAKIEQAMRRDGIAGRYLPGEGPVSPVMLVRYRPSTGETNFYGGPVGELVCDELEHGGVPHQHVYGTFLIKSDHPYEAVPPAVQQWWAQRLPAEAEAVSARLVVLMGGHVSRAVLGRGDTDAAPLRKTLFRRRGQNSAFVVTYSPDRLLADGGRFGDLGRDWSVDLLMTLRFVSGYFANHVTL